MFKIINTWKNPVSAQNQQRGFPAPGTGGQRQGSGRPRPGETAWVAQIPYQGRDTFADPAGIVNAQRGFPAPQGAAQAYAPGALSRPAPNGQIYYRETREFSRGAQRSAPITPILMASPNPGTVVTHKPNVCPRYPLGQYINNEIFWANQIIPTSVKLSGLQTKKSIDAMLSGFQVYGELPTL